MKKNNYKFAYAANRKIGLNCLKKLLEFEWYPSLLVVAEGKNEEFAEEMIKLLPNIPVLHGPNFRSSEGIDMMRSLSLDYFLSIHFPYLIPPDVLSIPKIGAFNLHPAFLPYNKGWHTPTWAIWENTPYGATFHWLDEGLDSGDIMIQESLDINPDDTADNLYKKVLELEEKLFAKAIPQLLSGSPQRIPQKRDGTSHVKKDIMAIQEIILNEHVNTKEFIDKLRALTTNKWSEAAYFKMNGIRYRIRVDIKIEE